MNEKVLGFKEKDAVFCTLGDEALYYEHYKITPKKLVPVISLKEHNAIVQELEASLEEKDEYIAYLEKKQSGEK